VPSPVASQEAMRRRIGEIAAARDIPNDEIRPVLSLGHRHIGEFAAKYDVNLEWLPEGKGRIFRKHRIRLCPNMTGASSPPLSRRCKWLISGRSAPWFAIFCRSAISEAPARDGQKAKPPADYRSRKAVEATKPIVEKARRRARNIVSGGVSCVKIGKTPLRLFRKTFATSAVPSLEIRNDAGFIFGRSSCQVVRRLGY